MFASQAVSIREEPARTGPLRILLAAPIPPQANGQGAIPVLLHAELAGLRERHDVTLVTVAGPDPAEWDAVDKLAQSGIRVCAVRRREPYGRDRWARRWRLGAGWVSKPYPFRTLWFWEREVQEILHRLLSSESFDVIHVDDNAMGVYDYGSKIPSLLVELEVRRPRRFDSSVLWRPHLSKILRELDWQRWRRYQLSVWSRFSRLQVYGAADAERMRALAPHLSHQIRVNPFAIELPPLTDWQTEEPASILFVGNFTHPPNSDAAMWLANGIMPRLRQRVPTVKLYLVGSFPSPEITALASNDVIVTGAIENVEPYLARAHVVVAPVRIGGGMRMKVLQAMAMGKPVVTTRRGAEGFSINPSNPELIIAESEEEIAKATAELLESPALRQQIGARARLLVERDHSPQAYAGRLEVIYYEMLREKGRA